MKVKDLIEKLQEFNQEADVILPSSNFELKGYKVSLSSTHQYDNGSKEIKTFRDAFDGGTYHKETYSIIGGNSPVVLLT